MKTEKPNKIKLLKLWEILERLAEMGIDCDRRTLYDDIKTLNHFGYEVECVRGASNEYSVDRGDFDVTELRILMDAVQAAAFVTEKKTEVLLDKVSNLAGSKRGEVLKDNITKFSTVKSTNENIYYLIDSIIDAIEDGK